MTFGFLYCISSLSEVVSALKGKKSCHQEEQHLSF